MAGDLDDVPDVSDDFLSQFIGRDCRSIKESNIELWCEQVLFNSALECAVDRELQNDFIDELYQGRTTTDQLSTGDESDGSFADQPQAADRTAGDDEVPAAIHTDDLAVEIYQGAESDQARPAKRHCKEALAIEFYGYVEDHDYLKAPSNYIANYESVSSSSTSNSLQIDKPLNSIDEFMQLNELNAFQSSNLDLYVNPVS